MNLSEEIPDKMAGIASWLNRDPRVSKAARAAIAEAYIVIHTPPDFPTDAVFMGVLAMSEAYTDQNSYGWMATDFLTWKVLMYTASSQLDQVSSRARKPLTSHQSNKIHTALVYCYRCCQILQGQRA